MVLNKPNKNKNNNNLRLFISYIDNNDFSFTKLNFFVSMFDR